MKKTTSLLSEIFKTTVITILCASLIVGFAISAFLTLIAAFAIFCSITPN